MDQPAGVDAAMHVQSREPFNAEPPPETLAASVFTPQPFFYVRSHGAVPALSATDHSITIGGLVERPLTLSLQALRAHFGHHSLPATLQCAGNRRGEMHAVSPVSGDPWRQGAIGNAIWGGVRLADVLHAAGVAARDGLHVAFTGADHVATAGASFFFAVSIPLAKALAPEVLLAFEMNGEPLAPAHGFPLRALVPGYAGVRSAKWLTGIEVRETEADSPIQRQDYKLLPPHITAETVDWAAGMVINELPLNSAICTPADGAVVPAGPLTVSGYAIAAGRPVARVDVSADGGATWRQADLHADADARWSWVPWRTTLTLPPGKAVLAVRAWDAAGQTQPASVADIWNFKGYLSAAWHRITVQVA